MPSASLSVRFVWGTAVLLSTTSMVWALSDGVVNNQTVLGSPLRVSVPVLRSDGDRRAPDCLKAEVQAGGNVVAPGSVRTRLERGIGDMPYRVHIATDAGILEPVVTVSLSVGCDTSVTRQFVLFIDPPGLVPSVPALNPAVASSAASTSSVRSSTTAASTALLPASGSASDPVRVAGAGAAARGAGEASSPVRRSSASTIRAPASRVPPRVTAAAKPGSPLHSGPRLSLEPPTTSPGAPGGTAPEPSAEAVAWANQVTLLNQLEDMLKQVTSESQAVQANVAGLQAKLRRAEEALKAERAQHRAQQQQPLVVWVLAATVGLLALALTIVLWRQRRRPAPFFKQSGVFEAPSNSTQDLGPQRSVLDSMPSRLDESVPVSLDLSAVSPAVAPAPIEPVPSVPAAQEWAMAEVVDLEQEADFFIALGQDQAAIDLLSGHMNSAGGHSPLPYLKLLDIHRRRGDRIPYEQLRLRFHRRFNARIPEWSSPAPAGSPCWLALRAGGSPRDPAVAAGPLGQPAFGCDIAGKLAPPA